MPERYAVAFANLQLSIEHQESAWSIRISGLNGHELLHCAVKDTFAAAQLEAVEFALTRLFGPGHRKNAAQFVASLSWRMLPNA